MIDNEQLTCEHDGEHIPLWEVEYRHGTEAETAEAAVRQTLEYLAKLASPRLGAAWSFVVRPILSDELDMLNHERTFVAYIDPDDGRLKVVSESPQTAAGDVGEGV